MCNVPGVREGYVVSRGDEASVFAMHMAASGLSGAAPGPCGRSPLRRRALIRPPRTPDHDLDKALPWDCGGVFEAVFSEDGGSSSWALTSKKW